MLKGQDVVVLLKLLGSGEPMPVRDLASQLGFDVAGAHRAMRRLDEAGLYSGERRRVFRALAHAFTSETGGSSRCAARTGMGGLGRPAPGG